MRVDEYARCDAVALRELIHTGAVSAAEVQDAARRAVDAVEPDVNGLAVPLFPVALASADDGVFAGVPFLIKDSGPMADGVPFFLGSRAVPGIPANGDTHLMRRFRAAGLVTLGVTAAPELSLNFATEPLRSGPTRNPWDLSRGVGGSSGGAAALVAAGAVPLAHGTDGAGSIRVPAACCGLVGLKPSRGRIPPGPDAGELALGMAYEFGLTRTVRDAAYLLDAVHGGEPGDKYPAPVPAGPYIDEVGRDPGRLRVALAIVFPWGAPVDPEVAAAAEAVGRVLDGLGHPVEVGGPDVSVEDLFAAARSEVTAMAAPLLLAPVRPRMDRMEAVTRRVFLEATALSALDLLRGLDAQNTLSRQVGAFFTGVDVLVTPTMGQLPAPHGTLNADDPAYTVRTWFGALSDYAPFTWLFNVTGQPAVSLPLGHSTSGLPIGVQIVAGCGREDLLFRVAAQLERALPWRDRIPPVHAGRAVPP